LIFAHNYLYFQKSIDVIPAHIYMKSEEMIMPNVYRALGDSTRRHILSMLKQGSKTR